jgi:hypothetical protein
VPSAEIRGLDRLLPTLVQLGAELLSQILLESTIAAAAADPRTDKPASGLESDGAAAVAGKHIVKPPGGMSSLFTPPVLPKL